MTEYQLRTLIYDLYCNDPKLRELSKDGVISSKNVWDWQDWVINSAKKDKLITD